MRVGGGGRTISPSIGGVVAGLDIGMYGQGRWLCFTSLGTLDLTVLTRTHSQQA